MCFTIESKNCKKKIAEKDIVCYKVVDIKIFSDKEVIKGMWHEFIYKLHKTYEEPKPFKRGCNKIEIETGFHSYADIKNTIYYVKNSYVVNEYYDPKLIKTQQAKTNIFLSTVIVKCVIPKGAEYYYNERQQEYVSNKIRLVSFVPKSKLK